MPNAGEILGLEWSRVDFARKVAWLDHGKKKSGEGRSIPLCANVTFSFLATTPRPALQPDC